MKKNRIAVTIGACTIFFLLSSKGNAQNDSLALNQLNKNKNGNPVSNNVSQNPKVSKMQLTNKKQGSLIPSSKNTAPVDTSNVTPAIIISNTKN